MPNKKKTLVDYIWVCVLAGITALCFMPIWHIMVISISDKSAVAGGLVYFYPIGLNFSAYNMILDEPGFFKAFAVSIERVLLGGAINFVVTTMLAYALANNVKDFRGRNIYMWVVVFTMLFSGGLIPWYVTIKSLGLLDSIWALVLPTAVPVFNVILLMNFFRNIPKEMKEAATVDGAGPWYIMARLFVPLSVPALATVTLFSVVSHWNAFLDGLLLMNKPDRYPLQTYIQQLVVQINTENLDAEQMINIMKVNNKTLNAAKIFVSMIPILLVYPFLQRYFIHGIMLGSVKE